MKLIINGSSMTPIYEQIMEGIRRMIALADIKIETAAKIRYDKEWCKQMFTR